MKLIDIYMVEMRLHRPFAYRLRQAIQEKGGAQKQTMLFLMK